jgi:hypothetical protein
MIDFSNTKTRVAFFIEQMKKAMPEVKHQIEVYENALKTDTLVKSPKTAPQFKNG